MIEVPLITILARAVNSLLTLYMMMILLRWLAPWLQVDVYRRSLRWMWRLTDPLINAMRRVWPRLAASLAMGPPRPYEAPSTIRFDLGPVMALFVVWIARFICVGLLVSAA